MGDSSSDWEGVRWRNDGAEASGYTDVYKLDASSLDNSNLAQPTGNEQDNSTFEGTYDCGNNIVTIIRETTRDEQDTDDGSVVRIEAGRVLQAIYWDADASRQEF